MGQYKKLWFLLFAVLAVCFTILGYMGNEIYKKAPPYSEKIASSPGQVLMTKNDILAGQSAWQTADGMEVGSVLGYGTYQIPDWVADWLYRELVAWLDLTAQRDHGKKFGELTEKQRAVLKTRAAEEYRNRSRTQAGGLVVSSDTRMKTIKEIMLCYTGVYGNDPKFQSTREHFVMRNSTLSSVEAHRKLFNFSFWTSWFAPTSRSDENFTYTNS